MRPICLLSPALLVLAATALSAEPAARPTTGDPEAAAAMLKSRIFPAQNQFQSSGAVDVDSDGRGQYGLLSELAGGTTATGDGRCIRPMRLLPDDFTGPAPVIAGWRYAVLLPGRSRTQTARSVEEVTKLGPVGEDEREAYWTAYAWPAGNRTGQVLKVSIDNVVMVAAWPGGDVLTTDDRALAGLAWSRYYVPTPRSDEVRDAITKASADLPGPQHTASEIHARILRTLAVACGMYQLDNDGVQVPKLATLLTALDEKLPVEVRQMIEDQAQAATICFVRSTPASSPRQPLIVQDPAVWQGAGCLVAFCDAHVEWIPGKRAAAVWTEAKRLAALPAAAGAGIAPAEWNAVRADIDGPSAAPKLLSFERSDVAGVTALLKKQILPAEVQFQAGGWVDVDQDGRGSYGFIHEMAGATTSSGQGRSEKAPKLLPQDFNHPVMVLGAWKVAVFLPGAREGAWVRSVRDCLALGATGEDLREVDWVGFAWPADGKAGTALRITTNGTVTQTAWSGGDLLQVADAALATMTWAPVDRPAPVAPVAAPRLSIDKKDVFAAASVLKARVFRAEMEFQIGGYVDLDEDGRGSYGFLDELAGATVAAGTGRTTKALSLLPPDFNQGPAPVLGAWRFTVFLPGKDKAGWVRTVEACRTLGKTGEDLRAERWVGFAWLADGSPGTVFKIIENGQILSAPWSGGDLLQWSDERLQALPWTPYQGPAAPTR